MTQTAKGDLETTPSGTFKFYPLFSKKDLVMFSAFSFWAPFLSILAKAKMKPDVT